MRPTAQAAREQLLLGLVQEAAPALEDVGIWRMGPGAPGLDPVADRRRRRLAQAPPPDAGYLSLVVDEHGLFDWRVDWAGAARPGARRAARRGPAAAGRVVEELVFQPVDGSQVSAFLRSLDGRLNGRLGAGPAAKPGEALGPAGGLVHLAPARASPGAVPGTPATPVKGGKQRILLLVHGTFSDCDALWSGLLATDEGSRFLAEAGKTYDQVLGFEHPTLAVSPVLNALDLQRALEGSAAQVDVVAHSRGGLVVRWWLEALEPAGPAGRVRAVLVGSPLLGTSLASPQRLRAALKLLTNVASALKGASGLAAAAVPLFGLVAGVMKLVGSVTGAMAGTPVVDAAVALVPGLAAQSRFGPAGQVALTGNFELERLAGAPQALLERLAAPPAGQAGRYAVVKSSFEPTEAAWGFLRWFRQPALAAADAAADLVFPAENDLVVDTASMDRLSPQVVVPVGERLLDFGTSDTVHHLNYFRQVRTVAFIRGFLGV